MSRLKRNAKRILGQPKRKNVKKSEIKWNRKKWKDKNKKRRRLNNKKTQRIEKKVNSTRKLLRRKMKLSTKYSMTKLRSRRLSMSKIRTVLVISLLNDRFWELIARNRGTNLLSKIGLQKKLKIPTKVRNGRRTFATSNPSQMRKKRFLHVLRPKKDLENRKKIKPPRLVDRKRCTKWSKTSSKRRLKVYSVNSFKINRVPKMVAHFQILRIVEAAWLIGQLTTLGQIDQSRSKISDQAI